MSIKNRNKAETKRAILRLEKGIKRLRDVHIPTALREIAPDLVAHSQSTKTYQNRTGKLVSSHFAEVVDAGKSKQIEFVDRDGTSNETFQARNNEVLMLLGAKMYYAIIVEAIYGFDVVIQTFLKWRREAKAILQDKLRTSKLF